METSDIEKMKEGNNKRAIHFSVLLGLVALAFCLDQLLFGSLESASLKQICGSAADLVVGCALAILALQTYLWQGRKGPSSSKAPKTQRSHRSPESKSEAFKAAQGNLKRDLEKAASHAKILVRILTDFGCIVVKPEPFWYI